MSITLIKVIDTFFPIVFYYTLLLDDTSITLIISDILHSMPATHKRKASTEDTVAPSKQQIKSIATAQNCIAQHGEERAKKRRISKKTEPPLSKPEIDLSIKNVPTQASNPMAAPKISDAKTTKRRRDEDHATPQNKRFKNMLPPSPSETPTRGASRLFDKLNLTPSKAKRAPDTPPLTPESIGEVQDVKLLEDLPLALQNYARLFSSFLNATSLYMAHHGSGSPLYLSNLCPLITKTWKKRRVSDQDVQRLLGVLGERNPFVLLDNGEGGTILERADHGSLAAGHFDQHDLCNSFEQKLCELWRLDANAERSAASIVAFIDHLPLASISTSDVAADSKKLAQSKDRLNRFKRDVLQSRADEAASKKAAVPEEAKTASAVVSRGISLLDRIMAKQQLLSSRPSGPTQDEIDRKAALDRVEEVVLIMEMLAGGRPRVSFSGQMMVQHLQNSLRNPISKDEAERCIALIANEVAPSFVSLIQTGNVRGVVVKRQGKLTTAQLKQSLERVGA